MPKLRAFIAEAAVALCHFRFRLIFTAPIVAQVRTHRQTAQTAATLLAKTQTALTAPGSHVANGAAFCATTSTVSGVLTARMISNI